MVALREPAITDPARERAGVRNVVANLELSARMSADCNIAVDGNDRRDGGRGLFERSDQSEESSRTAHGATFGSALPAVSRHRRGGWSGHPTRCGSATSDQYGVYYPKSGRVSTLTGQKVPEGGTIQE
jgi:hypothetical protein